MFQEFENVDQSEGSVKQKNSEIKKNFFPLTYGICSCGHSLDDEDKQQLFVVVVFCSLEVENFSSSVVVFVAGRHKGGGGNFFERVIEFVGEGSDDFT